MRLHREVPTEIQWVKRPFDGLRRSLRLRRQKESRLFILDMKENHFKHRF